MHSAKHHKPPTEKDWAEVAHLEYQIAEGRLERPEVRLARQLEAIVRKWDERLGVTDTPLA